CDQALYTDMSHTLSHISQHPLPCPPTSRISAVPPLVSEGQGVWQWGGHVQSQGPLHEPLVVPMWSLPSARVPSDLASTHCQAPWVSVHVLHYFSGVVSPFPT